MARFRVARPSAISYQSGMYRAADTAGKSPGSGRGSHHAAVPAPFQLHLSALLPRAGCDEEKCGEKTTNEIKQAIAPSVAAACAVGRE